MRKVTVCDVVFKKDEEYTVLSGYAAIVLHAGKYWWIRLVSDIAIGQWELMSADRILELSEGQLG